MFQKRQLLVTSALPYANGDLHLGHLVEHIQTDIWVRTQRLLGHDCISICGDDAHGTPIMLKAHELGLSPEALTEDIKQRHIRDFKAFSIDYNQYHTTHSPENKALAEKVYTALLNNGDVIRKTVKQAYDPVKQMFLPDRYVKGTCPVCKAGDQYGDNCEACGATYTPLDLLDAVSILSNSRPIEKASEHYFFDLPRYEAALKAWGNEDHLQPEVVNKLDEWFKEGLKPWCISRDAPYFGFLIPGTDDKYFYVWLDAPIGYMAAFKAYCDKTNTSFDAFWGLDAQSELYHFVGKDIIYFHALFWPALLKGSGYRLPTAVFAHGFLTVNGQKMSKSRGTFIKAATYLDHLAPAYLRYYFAAKLNGRVDDIDLNFDDFVARINADLVGKVVNIASRSAGFINKYFNNILSNELADKTLYDSICAMSDAIFKAYIDRDSALAMRLIMSCADKANQYIDTQKPWILAKEEASLPAVHAICTMGLNLFRLIMIYLSPVLPDMAKDVQLFLNDETYTLDSLNKPLLAHQIEPFKPLMVRIDKLQIEALIQAAQSQVHL